MSGIIKKIPEYIRIGVLSATLFSCTEPSKPDTGLAIEFIGGTRDRSDSSFLYGANVVINNKWRTVSEGVFSISFEVGSAEFLKYDTSSFIVEITKPNYQSVYWTGKADFVNTVYPIDPGFCPSCGIPDVVKRFHFPHMLLEPLSD